MDRRTFLRGAAALLGGLAKGPERAAERPRRPNCIFAFSDEHRWQSMSFTEMPRVRTPHMARLAAQGTSFSRCISNYPVCSPYRAILMTGRWPYQQGVIDNGISLRASEVTLGRVFRAAGYATGYIGKWHLGGTRAEPFGFDRSLVWTGTNDHWRSTYHPAGGPPVRAKGYNATAMTDQALEFIRAHRARPFLLVLSWNPPHSRFTDAPEAKKALYPEGSLPHRPNFIAGGGRRRGSIGRQNAWPVYQGYHAHVSAIDDELGRILRALDELGIAEDTILVYSSDHGSMLGSHGVGGKRQPYEESIRIPFILRWPRKVPAGRRIDALFGAIDILPTLCRLAGLSAPAGCGGRDLSAALCGAPMPDAPYELIMHTWKKHASGGERHPAPLFRGVTTGRYTYAVYPDRPWCLFDNREDPYQLRNRIDDPGLAKVRHRLRAMLAEGLRAAGDPFVIPA